MILLLDTNAFLWWITDNPKLGPRSFADIANSTNKVYISNLTLFEIAIKLKSHKLRLNVDVDLIEQELERGRIQEIQYDTWVARQFMSMRRFEWTDPFDLCFMATAIAKQMTLVTSDKNILASSEDSLKTIDARL